MRRLHARARPIACAAAASLVLAAACGADDVADPPTDDTEPPTTEPPTTEPATTEPTTTEPATTQPPTTEPATTEPATTEPATTEPTTTEPTTDPVDPEGAAPCTGDETGGDGAVSIVEAAVAGRQLNDPSFVEACLTAVPEVFDGTPPACWTDCADAERTFRTDHLNVAEMIVPDDDPSDWWRVLVPVTYGLPDGELVDATEAWVIADDGTVGDVNVNEPLPSRDGSLTVITDYLAAVERGDWHEAVDLLDDGGLGLAPERDDLDELDLQDYTRDEVARALEAWCAGGCDTRPPEADELEFTGSYGITRDGRSITAGWFEGIYSVRGLPARTG